MVNGKDLTTPKKRGRKRKLSTEQLMDIIEKYAESKPRLIAFKKTDLAKFANEELGRNDIIPHDFGRNIKVKEFIDELNEEFTMPKNIFREGQILDYDIDMEELVDSTIKDKKSLVKILNYYNKNHNKLLSEYKKVVNSLEKDREKYEQSIEHEISNSNKWKSKYEKEKKLNSKLQKKIDFYESYDFSKEKRIVETVEYLYKQKCCSELTESDLIRILDQHYDIKRTEKNEFGYSDFQSIKENYMMKNNYEDEDYEEYEDYDDEYVDENEVFLDEDNEENTNIISLNEKKKIKHILGNKFEDDGLLD